MDENNLTQAQYNLLKERENLLKTKDKLSTLGEQRKSKIHDVEIVDSEILALVADEEPISLSWDFETLEIKEDGKKITREAFLDNHLTKIDKKLRAVDEELAKTKNSRKTTSFDPSLHEVVGLKKEEEDYDDVNDVMLNPTAKVDLQQKQITSLMKQLNEYEIKLQHLVNENTLLSKDKQELLKVNKEWDKQHRLLNHEKKRIEAELRMRYGGVEEAMPLQRKSPNFPVDEDLKKTIVDLSTNNESLMIENSQLKEECKKRDSVCFSAKKLLQEERSAKETLMQAKLVGDEKVNELQTELEREKQRNAILKQEVERLVNVYPTENNPSLPSLNVTEQIEMLKQQISVYADDFASERADRERIQADRENQRNQIIDLTRENNLLQDQLHIYHNDFEKERREKERLQKLLKEHGRAAQQPEEPWYMVPPTEYITMHNPNRHQAWLHQGNVQHRYSPQEVQELAFQQQQPLHARGQAVRGHPDRLCRGCEADRDVIDGPAT